MVEQILADFAKAEPQFSIIALCYFNPVGAHESGLIGEDPNGIPNNLLPFIAQVAVGRQPSLKIFGDDYPTEDGTCVRDYIHVMDLAEGHLKAMDKLAANVGYKAYNLGAGVGYSVLQMVKAFKASGKTIPYEVAPRRDGDLAAFWADATLAQRELGWTAERDLDCMMRDTWKWQSQNPNGYRQPWGTLQTHPDRMGFFLVPAEVSAIRSNHQVFTDGRQAIHTLQADNVTREQKFLHNYLIIAVC